MYSDQNYRSAVSPPSRASPLPQGLCCSSGRRFLAGYMLASITGNQLLDPFKQLITLRLRAVLAMALAQPVMAKNQMHIRMQPMLLEAVFNTLQWTAIQRKNPPSRARFVDQRRHMPANTNDAGHFSETSAIQAHGQGVGQLGDVGAA